MTQVEKSSNSTSEAIKTILFLEDYDPARIQLTKLLFPSYVQHILQISCFFLFLFCIASFSIAKKGYPSIKIEHDFVLEWNIAYPDCHFQERIFLHFFVFPLVYLYVLGRFFWKIVSKAFKFTKITAKISAVVVLNKILKYANLIRQTRAFNFIRNKSKLSKKVQHENIEKDNVKVIYSPH